MLGEAMYTTIKTLWKQGYNKSTIAQLTGHDWKTVDKVIKTLQSGGSFPIKKPHASRLDTFQEDIMAWLEQGLTAVRIHEEIQRKGLSISYGSIRNYIKKLKQHRKIFIRIHTAPGKEAQVDFGYVGYTPDHQGKRRKTWVFNMRLSYSRFDFYKKVYDQKVETFIHCHQQAFHYFGGVPHYIKIDNLKAAILEANFYEPVYQKLYLEFSQYYGFEPFPCRVYRPNDKGKVESGIKFVKMNFFLGRQFINSDDVDRQLFNWLNKVNQRQHGTTKKVPLWVFESEEKAYLLKLPPREFALSKVGTRKVYHDCHVFIEGSYYSTPYRYVGKTVEVVITDHLVKIYYNHSNIATHTRLKNQGEFSTQTSHYPSYKLRSSTEHQERYQAKMAMIGPYAEQLFLKLLTHRKNSWQRCTQGVLKLSQTYSHDIVNRSCQRALAYQVYNYQTIKNTCKNGSYILPLDDKEYSHANN